MFRIIALRVAGAMVAVVAGLCLVVTVLASFVWAKGGSEADGMPVVAGSFAFGFLVCLVAFWLIRRRSQQVEARLDEQLDGQSEGRSSAGQD